MTRHYSEADLLETHYMQPGQSMPVMMHLAGCPECAARYDRLDRKLREAAVCHTEKPQNFWAQQRQTIMHCVAAARQPRSRRGLLGLAAAALLALVLGGIMISQREGAPPAPLAPPVAVEETLPSDPWQSEQLREYEAVVEWESWIDNENEGTS